MLGCGEKLNKTLLKLANSTAARCLLSEVNRAAGCVKSVGRARPFYFSKLFIYSLVCALVSLQPVHVFAQGQLENVPQEPTTEEYPDQPSEPSSDPAPAEEVPAPEPAELPSPSAEKTSSDFETETWDFSNSAELQKYEENVATLIQKGEYLQAQKLLGVSLKQKVKSSSLTFSTAKLLIVKGNLKKALKYLKLVENAPELSSEVKYTKARVFMALQKWELALAAFKSAEVLGYNSPVLEARALYSQGVALFELGRFNEAREQFARSLWSERLSKTEQNGAIVYLDQIHTKRPWAILVPAGLRYSGNLFKLADSSEVSGDLGQNSAWSFYLGLSATKIEAPTQGRATTGHQIRVHLERPLSLELNKLNATLVDYSYIQSVALLNLLQVRLQEFVGYFSPSAKQNFLRLGVESTWKTHLVGLGLDIDVQRKETPLDTIWLNALPNIIFTPGESDQIHIEGYFLYRRPMQRSDKALETVSLGIQPLYEFTISPQTQIDLGIPLQARYILPVNYSNEMSFGALLRLKQVFRSDLFTTFEASANGVLKGLGSATDPKFQARVVWVY
jgi:tetratricopeptide (TPR) repeat protein